MITIFLQKLTVVRAKNAKIFAKFFGKNILKIITSVPGAVANIRSFFWNPCFRKIWSQSYYPEMPA
jgi:hypothetical protein